MNKTTVIHHNADFDGLFCREIAKKFLPHSELIGWDFGDKPLSIPSEGLIYILDLPVDRVFGFTFPEQSTLRPDEAMQRIIWIDHHKSSIESHPKDIPGYRIDGVAACRLAWQWFNMHENPSPDVHLVELPTKQNFIDRSVNEPYAVRLAGEYDIWDKRDPNTDAFQFGLRSIELDEQKWKELLSTAPVKQLEGTGMDTDESSLISSYLLRNGHLLQRYQQKNDAGMVKRGFLKEFEGLKFLCLNTARCNSLTFASMDIPETGHDALMGFYWNGKWNVSLYHAKHRTNLDLSLIATKYGGGGHRGACGFQIDKMPFIP